MTESINQENLAKIIIHLEWLRDNGCSYKFKMSHFLSYYRDSVKIAEANTIEDLEAQLYRMKAPISATECGTVGCIAGHIALIGDCPKRHNVEEFAADWLGLSKAEADSIFYADWAGIYDDGVERELGDVTIDETIEYLKSLVIP